MRGWWEATYIQTSHNQHEGTQDSFQYGGVGVLLRHKGTHRITASGSDPHKLGRWTWVTLRGRSNLSLRLIAAYRPVYNIVGPTAVYAQHQRHFLATNRTGCPRELFIRDLCQEIQQWSRAGDQIVLGIDLNEDTHTSSFRREMEKLGMIDLFIARHGTTPTTYQRGTTTIDTIYVTRNLIQSTCGYLNFGEAIPSDHRALWVDLLQTTVFGTAINPYFRQRMRRLRCHDPRIVAAYNQALWHQLQEANLLQRLQQLQQTISHPPIVQQVQEWEAIDDIRIRAMHYADRHCRKLKVGAVPWSPAVQQSIDAITYWTLKLKRCNQGKVSSRLLQRLRRKAQITITENDVSGIKHQLYQAVRTYRDNKKQAQNLCTTWLEDLANARATKFGGTAAQQIAAMAQREISRREARFCKRVTGRTTKNSLTTVIAPNSEGQWVEWTKREDIEAACLQENRRRFQQASNTPFLCKPLRDLIDPAAAGINAQAIRDGTFVTPTTVDAHTKTLISALTRPILPSMISLTMTIDEYQRRWLKAKEYTATGYSGIHFGHFMAAARHPDLSQFDLDMLLLPFQYGLAPARWCQGLDVAIPKKAGNYRVDSLRTILLLEPDFNFLNKVIGTRMMRHAEHFHLLAPEQCGSRRHRSAAEHVVNKRLTFDLSRQTRQSLGFCSNDALSCYDRIVWPVASLSMQRVGVPITPIAMMINTLANMRHNVSSTYGISSASYHTAETRNFHGIGQGNGAAPAIWAVISSPMLNIQREKGYGAKFNNPLTKEHLHIAGYAFVDDTDICQTGRPCDTPEDIHTQLQQAIDLWTGSLRASGGALTPSKSFWVLCSYDWTDGRWKYQDQDRFPGDLTMADANGGSTPIERIATHEGRRTLGVRLAADGNNQDELRYLRQQSELWADYIRAGHLPRHLAWRLMKAMLWPKLSYPLPATTFTHRECRYIMAPALTAGLAAAGIVGTYLRSLTHCSHSALELELWDLYDLQGWAHICLAVRHGIDQESITGRLLRCSIATLQIELGLPGSPFRQDFELVGVLATESWVKTLWRYLWEVEMSLRDDPLSLELQREHDTYLTATFLQLGYRKGDLQALNRCRLYLQAITTADITTGCGQYITERAWKGQYEVDIPRIMGWPMQGRPGPADWDLWRKAISHLCQSSPSHQLPQALGRWLTVAPKLSWQFSVAQDRLYRQLSTGDWVFHRSLHSRSGRSRSRRFEIQALPADVAALPGDLQRAMASLVGPHILLSGCAPTVPLCVQRASSFAQYLQTTPSESSWLYANASMGPNCEKLGLGITQAICRATCDGSYCAASGAASWVIADQTQHDYLSGSFHTPGPKDQHSALRSELAGLYAVTLTIYHACQYFKLTSGSVEVGSDCTKALQLVSHPQAPVPTQANYDLIAAIWTLKSKIPIQ